VQVTFAPARAETELGALVVEWEGHVLRVPLSGEGLPACVPSNCLGSAFDLVSRRCVETALADGVACEAPCLQHGQCVAGRCAGQALDCDDGNACTVDACNVETGCVHLERACPNSVCQMASCDPGFGCVSTSEPDGRPCGPATCESASICLAGSCQVRPRPGASLACRYAAVAAGNRFSCAVNLLGELRCWGALDSNSGTIIQGAQPAWASPPSKVSYLTGVVSLAASGGHVCTLDGSGGVWCGDATSLPSGGTVLPALSRLTLGESATFALTPAGAGFAWLRSSGAVSPLSLVADAVDIAAPGNLGGFEVLLADGGVAGQAVATPVLRLEPWADGVHHITADGGVTHGGGSLYSGACTVGPSGPVACRDGSVVAVPGTIAQLTGNGWDHVCALTSTGEVWCWGGNENGQLGETSSRQLAPKELVASGAGDLVAGQKAVVVRVGDRLVGWGQGLYDLDGGLMGDGGVVTAAPLGTAAGATQLLGTNVLRGDGGVLGCWGPARPLADVSSWFAPDGGPTIAATCNGGTCLDPAGVGFVPECGPHFFFTPYDFRNFCLLGADGGVECGFPGQVGSRVVPLGGAATRLSVLRNVDFALSGCAVLAGGEVRCFEGASDGGVSVTPVPGLLRGARDVVGGTWSGCALVGSNTVQCWGGNFYGQLGRDGPSAPAALPITFSERVEQLAAGTDWAPLSSTLGGEELAQVCVRLTSGRVLCWGSNRFGQLGPVVTSSAVPLRVEL
jgi:hypothetical protein